MRFGPTVVALALLSGARAPAQKVELTPPPLVDLEDTEDSPPATPPPDREPPLARRFGPTGTFTLALGSERPATSFRLGGRYALSERAGEGWGGQVAAAGLLGYEYLPDGFALTVTGRLEALSVAGGGLLMPYFYAYAFAASGLVQIDGYPGMVARAGLGLGLNLFAHPSAGPAGCVGFSSLDLRGVFAELLLVLLVMLGDIEVYYERLQAGPYRVEAWRLGLGIGF